MGFQARKNNGCDIHQCVEVIPYAINEDKNHGSFILLNITQMPFCENILKGRHFSKTVSPQGNRVMLRERLLLKGEEGKKRLGMETSQYLTWDV